MFLEKWINRSIEKVDKSFHLRTREKSWYMDHAQITLTAPRSHTCFQSIPDTVQPYPEYCTSPVTISEKERRDPRPRHSSALCHADPAQHSCSTHAACMLPTPQKSHDRTSRVLFDMAELIVEPQALHVCW